jgi:hypothetical protein
MHPLEVQLNDVKAQLALKVKQLELIAEHIARMKEELEDLKLMLHPSRQKYAARLIKSCEEIQGAGVHKRH